jgi:hypothetical protein
MLFPSTCVSTYNNPCDFFGVGFVALASRSTIQSFNSSLHGLGDITLKLLESVYRCKCVGFMMYSLLPLWEVQGVLEGFTRVQGSGFGILRFVHGLTGSDCGADKSKLRSRGLGYVLSGVVFRIKTYVKCKRYCFIIYKGFGRGIGFRVLNIGSRIQDSRFRVSGFAFRV